MFTVTSFSSITPFDRPPISRRRREKAAGGGLIHFRMWREAAPVVLPVLVHCPRVRVCAVTSGDVIDASDL